MPEVRAPSAAKGRRITAAQPRDSLSSRAATEAAASDRVQTKTLGPAPEIVAPSAPISAARSTSSIDRGYKLARRG